MSAPDPVASAELCTCQCELTVEPTAPVAESSAAATATCAFAAEVCAGAAEARDAASDIGTSSADAAPRVRIKAFRLEGIKVQPFLHLAARPVQDRPAAFPAACSADGRQVKGLIAPRVDL